MANKLAGQRAKFTKALADYNRTEDDTAKAVAARKMAEVLLEAPANEFTQAEVTTGQTIPDEVLRLCDLPAPTVPKTEEDPDQQVRQLNAMVDTSDLVEIGHGAKSVYAYGYRCAPDRLKIGRSDHDVIRRVAQQISTSTPDRPTLFLVIRTDNPGALERLLHSALQLRSAKISGGGDEWYLASREALIEIASAVVPALKPKAGC